MTTTATEPTTKIGKASELGFDTDGGPWVALCLRHSSVVNVRSRDAARAAIKNTAQFCEQCMDSDQEPDEQPTPTQDNAQSKAALNRLAEMSEDLDLYPEYEAEQSQRDVGPDGIHGMGALPPDDVDVTQVIPDFDPSQTTPVTREQFQALDDSLQKAANEWWEQQHPNGNSSVTPQQPIVGTFYVGDTNVAHNAVKVSGYYFTAACGPTLLQGVATVPDNPDMCTYCLAGLPAPDEKLKKVRMKRLPRVAVERVARVRKEKPAPEPEPEPRYATEVGLVEIDVKALLEAFGSEVSPATVADARSLAAVLEPALATIKAMLPRRSRGRPSGAPRKPATPGLKAHLRGVQMPIARITKLLADEFPEATRCKLYVERRAEGKEINARFYVDADLEAGRIPEGVVTFS